jgi:gamma-glutamylcyclotransferase (GGCT)/AIG2-like uncharacterized protein YtfP
MARTELVFVYGTLRPPTGDSNPHDSRYYPKIARWLKRTQPAKLEGAVIHHMGIYPGARPGNGQILGDVLEIEEEALSVIDQIEGHPRFFYREQVEVQVENVHLPAWIYWAPASLAENAPILDGGDWLQRDENMQVAAGIRSADPHLELVVNHLKEADLAWFTSIRSDGRPFIQPMRFVWRSGRLYFFLTPDNQHLTNLASSPASALHHPNPEFPLVVEGWATRAEILRAPIRQLFDEKYGVESVNPADSIIEMTPLRLTSEGAAHAGSWRRGELSKIP